jgi:hypothetical protein
MWSGKNVELYGMNEIAQWAAITLIFCAIAWLFVCVYSDL